MDLGDSVSDNEGDYAYDVFICHASEDKDALVRGLANALREARVRVWYDEYSMRVGDSLRRKIDEGLSRSRFGIVVLSPAFFQKNWPARELDGLTALEMADGRSRILPIWLDVDHADVVRFSPPLAGLLALDARRPLNELVRELTSAILSYPHRSYRYFHEGKTIDVIDIARREGGKIDNHSFKHCHLLGPGILVGSDSALVGLHFDRAQCWRIEQDRPYVGQIELVNSLIEECTFDRVGFGLRVQEFDAIFPDGISVDGYTASMPGVSVY